MAGEPTDEEPENTFLCAACGDPIETGPAHRVVTWVEGDIVEHRHFCDASCRADWDG